MGSSRFPSSSSPSSSKSSASTASTSSNGNYSTLRKAIDDEKSRSRGSSLSKMKQEKHQKEHHERKGKKCHENCCEKCGYPCKTEKKDDKKGGSKCKSLAEIDRYEYRVKTEFEISGVGSIPVLKGDPKWLAEKVQCFIAEKARLMTPAAIYICNGSIFEADELLGVLKKQGVVETLTAYRNVHLVRTDPEDMARVEKATYITHNSIEAIVSGGESSKSQLVNYMHPTTLETELDVRFQECMRGRVMYVIPFSMGPVSGENSMNAVQLTDSPYVVINMRMMTRVSSSVWDSIGDSGSFARLIHSIGVPRPSFRVLKQNWLCAVEKMLIAHRLEENEVWSFGSGYGGNSLLGKKALSLRLASWKGRKEGWLAEHAAVLSITDPSGRESFITVHAPSGGGKTAFAFSEPTIPGWKIKILGDDIAWIRQEKDGRLYAMAPENGMFGIAPGLDPKKHPAAMKMLEQDALLVNTASTSTGKMFWRNGMELSEKETVRDWQGLEWTSAVTQSPAHPNARFTVFMEKYPNVHPLWDSPKGVPLTAMIFCSRRDDAYPLCVETDDWDEGVTMAAAIRAVASAGSGRKDSPASSLHNDPMGMRPFLAYNFAHYLKHWIDVGRSATKPPKIFHVNWFRKSSDGKALWPGYGENIRVIEWILKRCAAQNGQPGQATALSGSDITAATAIAPAATDSAPAPVMKEYLDVTIPTENPSCPPTAATKSAQIKTKPCASGNALKVPGGYIPKMINAQGLDAAQIQQVLSYDRQFWKDEVAYMRKFFANEMGLETPKEILAVVENLEKQLA
ncbi:unnamed protein product, partial [Mesorhabditis belari]|uniref:phosphoenolpyruvate carboxykinase (GTP) n=1 Tax=Mesorhabditis belari TaxID=2138241 RepID=A0AAF3EUH0_9BILA